MRRRLLLTVLAAGALALPAGALADHGGGGGGDGGGGGHGRTFELKGTLSGYTAAAGATNGSITIHVTKANDAGKPFVGMTLTFPVASTTQVDPSGAAIANGDQGQVQVKGAPGLDATGLQLLAPKEIEDESIGGDD